MNSSTSNLLNMSRQVRDEEQMKLSNRKSMCNLHENKKQVIKVRIKDGSNKKESQSDIKFKQIK